MKLKRERDGQREKKLRSKRLPIIQLTAAAPHSQHVFKKIEYMCEKFEEEEEEKKKSWKVIVSQTEAQAFFFSFNEERIWYKKKATYIVVK